jgi:hypothetical protein
VKVDVGICQGVPIDGDGSWIVFPNPTNGAVYMMNKGETREATIELIDMAGRVVWSRRSMMERGAMRSFNAEGRIAPGSYSMRIITDSGSEVRRIFVR